MPRNKRLLLCAKQQQQKASTHQKKNSFYILYTYPHTYTIIEMYVTTILILLFVLDNKS